MQGFQALQHCLSAMDLMTLPVSPHQIRSSQVFSSFFYFLLICIWSCCQCWRNDILNLQMKPEKKPVQDLKIFTSYFLSIYNFLGHQHSFSMLLAVFRYHKIELRKKWNRREFKLCYQRTALLPAVMKWLHEEQVRYDGGEGRRRLERRHLRKKKDAKQLFLFIPNLNICCFQHFLNVVFQSLKLLMEGDSIYSSEGCFLQ